MFGHTNTKTGNDAMALICPEHVLVKVIFMPIYKYRPCALGMDNQPISN
jgi:hypothetical protein